MCRNLDPSGQPCWILCLYPFCTVVTIHELDYTPQDSQTFNNLFLRYLTGGTGSFNIFPNLKKRIGLFSLTTTALQYKGPFTFIKPVIDAVPVTTSFPLTYLKQSYLDNKLHTYWNIVVAPCNFGVRGSRVPCRRGEQEEKRSIGRGSNGCGSNPSTAGSHSSVCETEGKHWLLNVYCENYCGLRHLI